MNRKPIIALAALGLALGAFSCNKEDTTEQLTNAYKEWGQKNDDWLKEQQLRTNPDGTPYYKTIIPDWNPAAYVLIHYFNDPNENADKLSPLSTSTIDARYIAYYYNNEPLDSSYLQTTYGPGVFRTQLNKVITGWTIAFETMHVGDTCEIVIPYQSAYGISSSSIPPYSNLRFNVRLVDIPFYETNPR